jgi:hypothetical protein
LESKPNLSILDQFQLMNDRNTEQNLRAASAAQSAMQESAIMTDPMTNRVIGYSGNLFSGESFENYLKKQYGKQESISKMQEDMAKFRMDEERRTAPLTADLGIAAAGAGLAASNWATQKSQREFAESERQRREQQVLEAGKPKRGSFGNDVAYSVALANYNRLLETPKGQRFQLEQLQTQRAISDIQKPLPSNVQPLYKPRQQQLALQNMGAPLAPIVRGPTTYTGVGRDNPELASNRPTTAPMGGGMGGMGQLPQPMMMPQQGFSRQFSERFPLMAEASELERLRMAAEGSRLQSQMRFQPQMDAIRQGIMGRMAGRLGASMVPPTQPYSSGSGYTPSWMQNTQRPSGSSFNPLLNQNFQAPQFPV